MAKQKAALDDYLTLDGIVGTKFSGLKGVLWTVFSKFIRQRDLSLFKGKCISCPTTIKGSGFVSCFVTSSIISREMIDPLMFDEQNVNLQCSHCSAKADSATSTPTAHEIDARWSPGTAKKKLMEAKFLQPKLTEFRILDMIFHYHKLKIDRIEKNLQPFNSLEVFLKD